MHASTYDLQLLQAIETTGMDVQTRVPTNGWLPTGMTNGVLNKRILLIYQVCRWVPQVDMWVERLCQSSQNVIENLDSLGAPGSSNPILHFN